MLLLKTEIFNDFSPEFLKELEEMVEKQGPIIEYKFNIAKENPDPEKYNGKYVLPGLWSLAPATFYITDKHAKNKQVRVALIKSHAPNEKGQMETKFEKIKIKEEQGGIYTLDISNPEDKAKAMYMLIHPRVKGSLFPEKGYEPLVERIDEVALATAQLEARSTRKKAQDMAEAMSDADIMEFATGMSWNIALPVAVLKNQVWEMAERDSDSFLKIAGSEKLKLQALVKKAFSKRVLGFDSIECKVFWAGTNQVLAMLSPASGNSEIEQMADWLSASKDGDKIKKKIEQLI